VAQFTVEKVNELGGKVVTMSDSSGFIHDPKGINADKLAWLMHLKQVERGRISQYAEKFKCEYYKTKGPGALRLTSRCPAPRKMKSTETTPRLS
jgi:glutamate dehydrogenase/leucine dehydrogenase